jgi:hypothetical protein
MNKHGLIKITFHKARKVRFWPKRLIVIFMETRLHKTQSQQMFFGRSSSTNCFSKDATPIQEAASQTRKLEITPPEVARLGCVWVTSTDVEPADTHLSSAMWGWLPWASWLVASGPRAFPLHGNTATGIGAIGVGHLASLRSFAVWLSCEVGRIRERDEMRMRHLTMG